MLKIVFITNDDPVNRRVLSGIAKSYQPGKTLCFFWNSGGDKPKSYLPTPRRVWGLLNTYARSMVDGRRTKQVTQRLGDTPMDFPNEERIATRLANAKSTAELISSFDPDIIVVCGAPILRERIFGIPKTCTINIHFGISSAYRGQHTLFWPMLENRFDQMGATIHKIDKGVDTGHLLFEVYPDVSPEDDEVSLELKIADGIVAPFVEMLKQVENSEQKELVGQPQQSGGKEIRYRDLGWLKLASFGIKKRLGLVKTPTIAARNELFYEVR